MASPRVRAAAEAYEGVFVLWVKTELGFTALAGVLGIPGTAGHQEHAGALRCRGCSPLPKIAGHVIHAPPAAAEFSPAGALGFFGVGYAFGLIVASTIGILEIVFAFAGGLPLVHRAEPFSGIAAQSGGHFLGHHVFGLLVWLVGVLIGVDADLLALHRYGKGVCTATVVAGHVVDSRLPRAAISQRVDRPVIHDARFVIQLRDRAVLTMGGIAQRNFGFAFGFATMGP